MIAGKFIQKGGKILSGRFIMLAKWLRRCFTGSRLLTYMGSGASASRE